MQPQEKLEILVDFSVWFSFFKIIYLFLEREEGREKERKRNINVWLPLAWPALGTWPTNQACALTGNQTSDPLAQHSTHLATPARADKVFFKMYEL